MKHIITPLLLIGCSLTTLASSKLDVYAQRLISDYHAGRTVTRGADQSVRLIVQLNDGYGFDDISATQVEENCNIGDGCYILDVEIPYIETLASSDAVARIEYGAPLIPCLNKARYYSNVDPIQTGSDSSLPQAYNGTGVLAGIYDEGFDLTHPMFVDDAGNMRVKVFNTGSTLYCDDRAVTRIFPNSYSWNKMSVAKTDWAASTHATQCSGIMAGGMVKRTATNDAKYGGEVFLEEGNIPFYGVATNADLFFSSGANTPADVLANFKRIVEYGTGKNQPMVLSLSMATYGGPHDGSTLFNREMAKLGEKAIICIASGNAGDTRMAVEKTLTPQDLSLKTSISYFPQSHAIANTVQFWGSNNELLKPEIGVYDKKSKKMLFSVTLDKAGSVTIDSGTAGFSDAYSRGSIDVTNEIDSSNDRACVTLQINTIQCTTANSDEHLVLVAIINGSAGQTINGIITSEGYEFVSNGIEGYTGGTTDGVFNDLAAGDNIISVGGYITKNSWVALDNRGYHIGNPIGSILGYSSYGKTFTGHVIPTVCAPGMKITCPLSSFYTNSNQYFYPTTISAEAYCTQNDREYYWQGSQGTSLAAPFVAGTVALWLQANPQLTFADVLSILETTSNKDSGSQGGPWGNGKLDALAGIKMALDLGKSGVENIDSDMSKQLLVTKSGAAQFNIYYGGGADGYTVSVYSLNGVAVKSAKVSGSEYNLDASALASGIYILEISGENFREVRKIVVE